MKLEKQGTYIGDDVGVSVSESVMLTINKRIGLVIKGIFEIKSVVEHSRSQRIGGIQAELLQWKSCLIPYLFNNAATWLDISTDMQHLTKLQNLFLNMLLGVYKCPTMLMYWDLRIPLIPLRILKIKLLLFHHISCLPAKALSHRILKIQQKFYLPGLNVEVKHFLAKHQIIDVKDFSKQKWSKFVDHNVHSEIQKSLIEWSQKYKKLDTLSLECENYETKSYFFNLNLANSKMKLLGASAGPNSKLAGQRALVFNK